MQLIPSNPIRNVTTAPDSFETKTQIKNFDFPELQRFFTALDEDPFVSDQMRLFFIVAMFSGARRGEILALDWSDIDFNGNKISFSKSLSKTKQQGTILKVAKTPAGIRVINMPESVMVQLKAWKKQQMEYRLQLGTAWVGDFHVFTRWSGGYMAVDTPTHAFRSFMVRYNEAHPDDPLPQITLHGLRHASATILISENTDIVSVSKRLGHSKTSVTLDIYSHAVEERDRVASDKLGEIASSTTVSINGPHIKRNVT